MRRALGDARVREIVEEYMEAMRNGDVNGYSRWPEYAADPERVQAVFERFGLPGRLA